MFRPPLARLARASKPLYAQFHRARDVSAGTRAAASVRHAPLEKFRNSLVTQVTLNAIGTLTPPIANPTDAVPYPNPAATAGMLGERARAYLHTNCSQCHRPGGPTSSSMDLRYSTALANANACDVAPGLGDLGLADARIIAPGAPGRSVIPVRMNLRGDPNTMPPVGSARVDTAAVTLMRDWIDSLANCN